jgi:hypothetical protein
MCWGYIYLIVGDEGDFLSVRLNPKMPMPRARRRLPSGKWRVRNLPGDGEPVVLFESDGLPVQNRMYVVVTAYIAYAVVAVMVFKFLDERGNDLKYAFLVVAVFGIAMAMILLVQTRVIGNVVVFEHGLLIPYHASHPVPAFTRFNRVVPWKDIMGIERRHGLRIILADGRDFLLLFHHDQIDELEAIIRQKIRGT